MTEAFGIIQKALTSLEMFREHYGSTQEYHSHVKTIVGIIREVAVNKYSTDLGNRKVLLSFADAIEVSHKPDEYVRHSQSDE